MVAELTVPRPAGVNNMIGRLLVFLPTKESLNVAVATNGGLSELLNLIKTANT